MKQVNVDAASAAVKKFIRSLPLHPNGVEVTLDGRVVCKIVPPGQLSDTERAAQLNEVGRLLVAARSHSKRLPATLIEQRIRYALNTVRQRR
jgi:hypothetical protein